MHILSFLALSLFFIILFCLVCVSHLFSFISVPLPSHNLALWLYLSSIEVRTVLRPQNHLPIWNDTKQPPACAMLAPHHGLASSPNSPSSPGQKTKNPQISIQTNLSTTTLSPWTESLSLILFTSKTATQPPASMIVSCSLSARIPLRL